MIIGRNFSCYKRVADGAVSVLLEHKQKSETLLFEKGVVAELGSYLIVFVLCFIFKICAQNLTILLCF